MLEGDKRAGASNELAAHYIIGGLPYYKGGGTSNASTSGIFDILINILFEFPRC